MFANICAANSLVGVNIKARIGLWLKCFPCDNICKMGSVKPAVFQFLFVLMLIHLYLLKWVVLLLLYWRRWCILLLMAFNKASDKPNELNDINGVYEANFIFIRFFK
jgi:hypothetical protein